MEKLITEYTKARKAFIEAVDKFPKDRRQEKLFNQWNLKQLITHLAGWDNCIADNIIDLKNNREPKFFGTVDDYNKHSVEKGKSWNWGKAYSELIKGGGRVVEEYTTLPKELWQVKFWKTKNSTPEKFLKIVTKHYSHEHLPQLLKLIEK